MGSKLFDQLDLINITEGFTIGPNASNATYNLVNNSFSNFEITGSGLASGIPSGNTTAYTAAYIKHAQLNPASTPEIPEGAMINRVLYRFTASIVVAADAHGQVATGAVVNVAVFISLSDAAAPFGIISFSDFVDNPDTDASTSGGDSVNGTISDNIIDPPITVDQFYATYGSNVHLQLYIQHLEASSANAGPDSTSATLSISDWSVEVFWQDPPFQFSIETESPVQAGDEIEIGSDPFIENHLELDQVTEVTITYKTTDNVVHTATITSFVSQGPNSLIFILPDIGDAPTVEIEVTVDGTQFSGTVPLGTLLTIFFTNGTGIYRIVPGKANDTLYVQDYDPVETVDVKIPNPFFKTGFLPDV